MTPRITKCVERARYYQDQILKEVSKHQTADNSDCSLVSTAYIKMVNGDYGAILTSVAAENAGAAFKLFRLLYEDVINALWVQAFAPPGVIKKLLKDKKGHVPGTMADRAAKLDTIFVPPAAVVPEESLFVDLQSKFWKAACSYMARLRVPSTLAKWLGKRNHEFESNPLRRPVLCLSFLDTLSRTIALPADDAV